jgi:hypothetical protein
MKLPSHAMPLRSYPSQDRQHGRVASARRLYIITVTGYIYR